MAPDQATGGAGGRLALAARAGLVVGLLHGAIDIASRVFSEGYEWFELYQPFLLSGGVCAVGFLAAAILLELAGRLLPPLRFLRDHGRAFWLVAGACTLLFLLGLSLINTVLPGAIVGGSRQPNLVASAGMVGGIGLLFLLALWKLPALDRWCARFSSPRFRAFSGNALFVVSVFTLSCLGTDLYLQSRLPRANPARETRPDAPACNVLLVTLDTVRADHLTPYGHRRDTTPFLNALAAKSVLFEQPISASSWTLPAHASLLTGQYSFRHGAHSDHMYLKDDARTLAEAFAERGAATGAFVGGPFCKRKYGLGQGFGHYSDRLDFFEWAPAPHKFDIRHALNLPYWLSGKRLPRSFRVIGGDGERVAAQLNRDFFAWADGLQGRPFFAFLNYFEAHEPYELGREYLADYAGQRFPDYLVRRAFHNTRRHDPVDPALVEYMKALYDAEIRALDDGLKALMEGLAQRGLLENTAVFITADHGEEFREHGGFDHGLTLFEEVVRVPLLVHYPARFGPRRIATRVETLDFFSSALELAGLPRPENVDSTSLVAAMEGKAEPADDTAYSELLSRAAEKGGDEPHQQAFYSGDHKLIEVRPSFPRLGSGLYDLADDPGEQRNRYADDTATKEKLRAAIRKLAGGIYGEDPGSPPPSSGHRVGEMGGR